MQADGSVVLPLCDWGVKLSFSSKRFLNWKVRRFELTQREFKYSDEKLLPKNCFERGRIVFAEAVVPDSVPTWASCSFRDHYPFPIRIWLGQDPFYFALASAEQQSVWIAALNNQKLTPSLTGNHRDRSISRPPHKR